jgi:multiple sugar transport system permease protein
MQRALPRAAAPSSGAWAAIESFVDRHLAVLFPLPAVVAMAAIIVAPLAWLVWLSLHDWTLTSPRPMEFVGLQNYQQLFRDTRFLGGLRITAIFTVSSVLLQMLIGLGLALLLNRNFHGKGLARTAILLPMMATPAAVALAWRMMFSPEIGALNWMLRLVGHPGLLWVSHPATALASLIMVDVLRETPFTVIVLLAGLAALPPEPYEAAKIDGASPWQCFWHITLPLLRSALVVALIFRAIFTIKVFDVIYVITQGGPAFSTENFTIFAYLQAFSYWRMGYASAAAVLFFLLILAVTLPMIALRRKSWEY